MNAAHWMAIATCFAALPAAAQNQARSIEFGGFLGGATVSEQGGTHPNLGLGVGYFLTDKAALAGEVSYSPLGTGRVSLPGVFEASSSGKLVAFDANAYYHFTDTAIAPYAVGGIGLAHVSANVIINGQRVNESTGETKFTLNLGAGVRWFLGSDWGVRPELKVVKLTGDGGYFVRYTVALFWQSRR